MNFYQNLYNPFQHINMLNDKNRMNFYYEKIYKNSDIRDKVCCDVGSGTGILALLALRAGAKHVYIIENQINMIDIIKYYLSINNIHSNRYTILQGWSSDITLPEKVDVIIHELIGQWGNGEQGLSNISEFKCRNLKKNGQIIPDIIEVHLTLQYTNEEYEVKPNSSILPILNDMKISELISKLNENESFYNNRILTNRFINVKNDNSNYLYDTTDCNTEIIKYDLINDSLSDINEKICSLNFTPKSNKIVSLLSTLKYYCDNDKEIYGDTLSNNGNWQKQIILMNPYIINNDANITGSIYLKNNPRCKYSQMIKIKLETHERNILYTEFITSIGFNLK